MLKAFGHKLQHCHNLKVMQKLYKLFLPILVMLSGNILASPIDSVRASKVATNFMLRYADRYQGLEFSHKNMTVENTVIYYVFNLRNAKGYIVVSADDACFPVLCYSTESRFDTKNIPVQLNKWLWHRAKEISYIKKQGFEADEKIKQEWENLENPKSGSLMLQNTVAVAPLMTTKWNQSPFYNDLCPYDEQEKGRAVTGCVATAMAQIMKYHKHPQKGQGIHSYVHEKYGKLSAEFSSTTYDWANMPDEVKSANTAVATLMYHCGVGVDMNYGVRASGASPDEVARAMKKYFDYDSTTKMIVRKSYTETNWINEIKSELNAKRPVEYNGYGTGGGHAFVCDGYDNNDFFHFNWGWGGSADGYFNVNALNPGSLGTGGGDGGFNSNQTAVIGIKPAPNTSVNLQLYKTITVNPTPLYFGSGVTVTFNVVNRGASQFAGDYAAVLFDQDFKFVSFIGNPITNQVLEPGFTYTYDLTFTQKSTFLSEGNYYIAAYYRDPRKEWQILAKSDFENPVKVNVPNVFTELFMYGTPLTVSTTPIIQNQPFEVALNIANPSDKDFEGEISLGLYDLEGQGVATIDVKTDLFLGPSQTFSAPIVFTNNGLNIPVGSYLLAPTYKKKNDSIYHVLSAYRDSNGVYPNLIRVIVAAQPLEPDNFEGSEGNDKENTATSLPVTFSNNSSTINTEGSVLQSSTDIDYYQIDLPSGSDYEITAQLYDSENNGNGKVYTVDALFSYKIGSGEYSDAFDKSIGENNSKIYIKDKGKITFKVAPFFVGEKGSYLLEVIVNKVSSVGIQENLLSDEIRVYPHPASHQFQIDLGDIKSSINKIELINFQGQVLYSVEVSINDKIIALPVMNHPNGTYFARITSANGITTKKLIIQK
jgi:hypothetical protein